MNIFYTLLFSAAFLASSASGTAFRQKTSNPCDCQESLFGDQVVVLPDSLRTPLLIQNALFAGGIQLPDTLPVISTGSIDQFPSCVGRMTTDLDALEEIFGESLFTDCFNNDRLISIRRYEYFNDNPSAFFPYWNDYPCENPICYLPVDIHALQLTVQDSCGELSSGLVFVEVKDLTPPVARCKEYLSITIDARSDGNERKLLTTEDFNAGSWDNCSPTSVKIRRPIYYPGVRDAWTRVTQDTLAEEARYTPWRDSIYFFCGDDESGLVELQVTDEAGNTAICSTFVEISNLYEVCGYIERVPSIFGDVRTENGMAVSDVQLVLSGPSIRSVYPSDQGFYEFSRLTAGGDFEVTPNKEGPYSNGLSTFDLIRIQQHILGHTLLESPYQIIAADVNNSQSITVLDLIQLRKLILNIEHTFPNNSSWRFVEATYEFPNPQNPWQEKFPESAYFENINPWGHEASFIAIKIGDVNSSVNP